MVSNNTYSLSPNVHKRREILIKKFNEYCCFYGDIGHIVTLCIYKHRGVVCEWAGKVYSCHFKEKHKYEFCLQRALQAGNTT